LARTSAVRLGATSLGNAGRRGDHPSNMVVFGGLYALLDSDDELDQPLAPEKPIVPPTVAFLTPRPWTSLYNLRVRAPVDAKHKRLSLIQRVVPHELMVEIFKRAAPADVSRAACACRPWRLLTQDEHIWEKACLDAWEYREHVETTHAIARDRFRGSYRRMFFARPRLRTEGLYVSRNTYIKPGITDWENVKPVHLVCYYRYFRFFNNGEFMSKTSPERLSKVFKLFKTKYAAARDDGVYHGGYSLQFEGDDSRLHLECTPRHRNDDTHTTLHMWLRLRGTHPGASNRLDFVKLASVDGAGGVDESPVPFPTLAQWEEVDDPGLAYRRSCGINIKRYNGTLPVRDFNRGLNTLVFVPWEHAADHVLNNSAEEMDFFVTG
jgi:F-box protein 9